APSSLCLALRGERRPNCECCNADRNFAQIKPRHRVLSGCLYNALVTERNHSRLDRVLAQLRLYEHPLLDFSARAKGDSVELIIQFKNPPVPVHTYYFDLHPRDLDNPQFEWSLQRQLYDCLHDYLVEMFIRTPQDRLERQREGL
ncbi:MAG TPA: hypothetical protein VK829_04315, partial [Terriglobales bacterium]|nr:hypothetical protein [Terriglobales bacterium]